MLILSEAIKNRDSHDEISVFKERRETLAEIHFFFFGDRVSLCSLDWPRIHYVDQAGLKFIEITCLSLPSTKLKGMRHHACFAY